MKCKVTLIAGTNRANSTTRKVVSYLENVYASLGAATTVVDLSQLPPHIFHPGMYEGDERPITFRPMIEAILQADALVVCVPEYNGGMPGVTKLFIDLLPDRDNILGGKPVAFVGVAAGEWGGMRPVEQIASIFAYRKAFAYPERVFIRDCEELIAEDGSLVLAALPDRLKKQACRFLRFARAVAPLKDLFVSVPEPG